MMHFFRPPWKLASPRLPPQEAFGIIPFAFFFLMEENKLCGKQKLIS